MTETERNKAIVVDYWRLLTTGRVREAGDLITDDARIFTLGDMPVGGMRGKAGFLAMIGETMADFTGEGGLVIGEMTAEDDRVAFEVEARMQTKSGKIYNNQFHWLFYFRDGKIAMMKEYHDTLHVYETLRGDQITGPRIARQSNITNVSARLP